MTPERKARARELLAKATPGPWAVWECHAEVFANVTDNTPSSISGVQVCAGRDEDDWESDDDFQLGAPEDDAALIAAAPDLLAEALDTIDRALKSLSVDGHDGSHMDGCSSCRAVRELTS